MKAIYNLGFWYLGLDGIKLGVVGFGVRARERNSWGVNEKDRERAEEEMGFTRKVRQVKTSNN